MKLYRDDDSASRPLVAALRNAGHDVIIPADAGMAGKADPVHLRYAIQQGRTQLTKNYTDFPDLHLLVLGSGGHHPGLFLVREDNDPTRDMKPGDIVRAIARLEQSGLPIANELHILNHWR